MAVGKVSAIDACASFLVTYGGMAVALTSAAVWERPEARLTLIALAAGDSSVATFALSGLFVAGVVQRADAVTVALRASVRAEAVGANRALLASKHGKCVW